MTSLVAIGAGLAALTGIGAGVGIGIATSKATDAIARQPEAEGKITKALLLGCALAEGTAIFGMVVAILIKLTQAHKESSEIIEKARKSAQTEYNNKVSVASAEADRIIKDAHKAVELDREKTVQDLQSEIAGLAVAAAEKVLGESGTKESNQLMSDQFLAKAGGVNDTDSE